MIETNKDDSLLAGKIRKKMVQAINDYSMIQDGDRVMVAVSGGKDSTILALQLEEIRKKSKLNFTLTLVLLDQKQPGFKVDLYARWLQERGLSLTVIEEDTYSIVKEKVPEGKTTCGLCSRLRRGILYNYAYEHAYNKIALGHHRDDLNETVLMNMFFTGSMASMPPKLVSNDKRNIVIRPMSYVDEESLLSLSRQWSISVIPCNLCGSQKNLQRQAIKSLLHGLEGKYPDIKRSLLKAQANIKASQMLDRDLWSFEGS